ncbi:MAG: PAS domain S-box protein [Candidatus Acidiferrum sp.]
MDTKGAELTSEGGGDFRLPEAADLEVEVEKRFGLLPNFFRLTAKSPAVTAKLWGFAQAAYLDIPLPSLFKERLFVHLSRFCEVRYCIARHAGFLAGLGRPSGDLKSPVQTVEEIIRLLRRPFPRGQDLERWFSLCAASHGPLGELPSAGSDMEEAIFACAGHVFLQTPDAAACHDVLKVMLGGPRLQDLIVFLAFVRTAHYWTKVHRELTFEDDIKQLLATHEALAECIFNDPEAASDKVSQTLLDELASLRNRAGRETNLLAAIVDSSDDAIISKTLDGIITSWNQSAGRLFGYTAEEAVGQHITLIIPSDRRAEETKIIEHLKRGERMVHFETVRLHRDGTELDISLTVSPVRDFEGRVVGASKVARDITQQKRAERALRENEERLRSLADGLETQVCVRTQELEQRNTEVLRQSEQLRELSKRLLQTQDDERRRIARELHDSAGQIVTALSMNLGNIAQHARQNPLLGKAVEESGELVQQLSKEIRTMSYLLHPPLLDENGLSEAIRWYMQGLTERSGLNIELNISENFGRLPAEIEVAVFRIVQECLTNIHRHSGSKTAAIRLSRTAESIVLQIQDEGIGIAAEKLAGIQSQRSGVGITGMRERVRHFRGALDIQSDVGRGTKIAITFPAPMSAPLERGGVFQPARAGG